MAIFPGLLLSLGLSAVQSIRNLALVIQHRRQAHDLATWGDRELKDIGLTRSDLSGALSLPLREDPTLHLASLSGRSPRAASEDTLRKGNVRVVKPAQYQPGPLPSTRPALSA
ncbi:MAG: DUF1127 domain-containing protein [Rhabdaerophilum sp.]